MSWIDIGRIVAHSISVSAIGATLIGLLPPLTAVVIFVYYCSQIYEAHWFQRFLRARRESKIAKYKAKIFRLETAQAIADENITSKH